MSEGGGISDFSFVPYLLSFVLVKIFDFLLFQASLHLQNGLLYTFGIFLNAGGFVIGALQSDNQSGKCFVIFFILVY